MEWLETVLTDAHKAAPSSAAMLVVPLPPGAAVEFAHGGSVQVVIVAQIDGKMIPITSPEPTET